MVYSRCQNCDAVGEYDPATAGQPKPCPRCGRLTIVTPESAADLMAQDKKLRKSKASKQGSVVVNAVASVLLIIITGGLAIPVVIWWWWRFEKSKKERVKRS